ncbi:MAG: CRISPR-associated endoribonuclease Cas6 [Melioribacteraceae bacterium]|nr:CRISPR-associated endoribonuclease Cas6 [Melioribacteraceae bacterium]
MLRLHFKLTQSTQTVPFDYQHFLIGAFHKWMGINRIHDEVSLYSMSWLQNGKMDENGFNFPNGAFWFISFWDELVAKELIEKSMKDPEVCCGMNVSEIQIQENPNFGNKERFIAASPIFVRKYEKDFKAVHLTVKDAEANHYLNETLQTKLKKANLDFNVSVRFDENYLNPKTKLVKIKDVESRANFCPVIAKGDPEAIQFLWNVGAGHSTGSGFGALY